MPQAMDLLLATPMISPRLPAMRDPGPAIDITMGRRNCPLLRGQSTQIGTPVYRKALALANDAPAAVRQLAGRAVDHLWLAIDPDGVLEVAAQRALGIVVGIARNELAAMPALRVFPFLFLAGEQRFVGGAIGIFAIGLIEASADGATDHRAERCAKHR